MALANAHFNIVHSPLIAAAQSVTHEQDRVESNVRAAEIADRARQAEEQVREVQPAENDAIQEEEELPADALLYERRRRKRRRKGASDDADDAEKDATEAGESARPHPDQGNDPLHHIDITI